MTLSSLFRIAKLLFFLWMTYVVIQRFSDAPLNGNEVTALLHLIEGQPLTFFIVVMLMPLNWLLEMVKWRLLFPTKTLSFSQAGVSVLGGLAAGFASPARIGEFAGRALLLPAPLRKPAVYLSALSGLSQSVVTIGAAIIGWWISPLVATSWWWLSCAVIFILLVVYFQFSAFAARLNAWPVLAIPESDIPTTKRKSLLLGVSLIRYAVYVIQYALLFQLVGVHISITALASGVSFLLLLQAVSPLAPLFDIITRSGTAILLFEQHTAHPQFLALVPLVIWSINLVLPAFVGYYFIWRWNYGKE
ncbi:MAG: hypothetical protein U0T84_13700 [Chitinophagales bacterium]